ncbi:YsnF/AvaK domain-containing protein [Curtobacterium sp. MCPF17_052]|uniref:YsnF/AvaK domain-containing protein n=1 Tax=Curtobacterium sp. MCPF17_052 TaxID=2175655 RepID=UPI0024E03857|nr:YsnF/AvaK domain-containing protein [Curtobacterium sp. MCPF17_052]WIB13382.1 YsnF/AvaK domain-containing protein [Curtobacterium sp. MCPF17_052]
MAYDKDRIKDAPRIDADGDLSDDEQDRIFDHYGLGSGAAGTTGDGDGTSTDTGADDGTIGVDPDLTPTDPAAASPHHAGDTSGRDLPATDDRVAGAAGYDTTADAAGVADSDTVTGRDTTDTDRGVTDTTASAGHDTTPSAGHDTSGPDTDDAMTRSEQRLDVGTQRVQTGRARLRKHVVTEQQNITVPVQHEELRVETEPITDGNVGAATDGPDLSEEEHEVTLSEERVVVDKETVPVERVRLGTETVTEQQQVSEDVAHEEIDLDQDGDTRR